MRTLAVGCRGRLYRSSRWTAVVALFMVCGDSLLALGSGVGLRWSGGVFVSDVSERRRRRAGDGSGTFPRRWSFNGFRFRHLCWMIHAVSQRSSAAIEPRWLWVRGSVEDVVWQRREAKSAGSSSFLLLFDSSELLAVRRCPAGVCVCKLCNPL